MNNNNQFEKFIRDLNDIRMSDNQKNEMRNNLEHFALNYDVKPVWSPYQFAVMFKRPLAIALIVFLAIGSTKPASASALPGEILYPVKMIHEGLEAATKTTPERKANFKIEQTKNRIQEAIELADDEKLDSKTQNQLAANIKKYTENIAIEIKEIQVKDPQKALAITADLKTTLKSNSGALKKVTSSKKAKKETTQRQELEKKAAEEILKNNTTIINKEILPPTSPEITTEKKNDSQVANIPLESKAPETTIEVVNVISPEDKIINPEDMPLTAVKEQNPPLEEGTALDNKDILQEVAQIETLPETAVLDNEEYDDTTLLDSLELDLIFTETMENNVKDEIIKTLDESPIEEETIVEIIPDEKNNIETIVNSKPKNTLVNPINNSVTDPTVNVTPLTTEETVTEEIPTANIPESEFNLTPLVVPTKDRIKKEITALENVSNLKERLDYLEKIHNKVRTLEEQELHEMQLQKLIDKGQYGQAIIYIQSEISIINELEQVRKIEDDLGIGGDEYTTEVAVLPTLESTNSELLSPVLE